MSKSKRARDEGFRCSLMPGEVFTSDTDADEMRVTRQMNVARGGMGQVDYVVRQCRCRGYHLMTLENFQRWDEKRRATQREKKRNA